MVRRSGGLCHRTSGWHKPPAPGPRGPSCVENLSPDDELSNENLGEKAGGGTSDTAPAPLRGAAVLGCGFLGFNARRGETPPQPAGEDACATGGCAPGCAQAGEFLTEVFMNFAPPRMKTSVRFWFPPPRFPLFPPPHFYLTPRLFRPILTHDGETEHAGGASETHP